MQNALTVNELLYHIKNAMSKHNFTV